MEHVRSKGTSQHLVLTVGLNVEGKTLLTKSWALFGQRVEHDAVQRRWWRGKVPWEGTT